MLFRMLTQSARNPAYGFALTLAAILSLIPLTARSELVSIKVSDKITATADYIPAGKDRPVILMMHGFLQSREFAIVKSMADELGGAGYAVLNPSLSLGTTNRNTSLDCEALHLHSMSGDTAEIQQWVQWLRGKGYKKIVGLGHSFGGTQLLAWADQYPHQDFRLIAMSLVGSMPAVQRNKPAAASARKQGARLLNAPLSFCNSYTSPANNYFSYLDWNEKRILTALKSSKVPTDAILGSDDNRLVPDWEKQLEQAGIHTHTIQGANHFLDGTHEFDVLEVILDILKK